MLVNKPRVLPQDETFSSLNAQIRLMMRELLLDVWSEYRMSVPLYSDVDEAGLSGLRAALLTRRQGRLKALFEWDG